METRPKIPFTPAKVPHRRRKLWSVPWPPFFGNHQQPDTRLITTYRFQKQNEVISINAEKALGSFETSHQFWIHWRRTGNTIQNLKVCKHIGPIYLCIDLYWALYKVRFLGTCAIYVEWFRLGGSSLESPMKDGRKMLRIYSKKPPNLLVNSVNHLFGGLHEFERNSQWFQLLRFKKIKQAKQQVLCQKKVWPLVNGSEFVIICTLLLVLTWSICLIWGNLLKIPRIPTVLGGLQHSCHSLVYPLENLIKVSHWSFRNGGHCQIIKMSVWTYEPWWQKIRCETPTIQGVKVNFSNTCLWWPLPTACSFK